MRKQLIRGRDMRLQAGAALVSTMLLGALQPSWAAATTITLETVGTLQVDRTGSLTAELPEALPSSGFFDVYTGTFTLSVTGFPSGAITQPYAFALTGAVTVGNSSFSYDDTPLPSDSAATANTLATEARELAMSPSGAFFPSFLPNTFYEYDDEGHIVIASQTDLATLFADVGPLGAFYADGTYGIDIPGLTLVATPILTSVPEPAALTLFGLGLVGLGATGYRSRRH